jgi:uncharacterized protein (TIGR02266 family)
MLAAEACMAENDKRGTDRVPAAMRIRLRYTDVETFVDRYATNVSKGGIFIASRTPKAVGALVRFEFQLADGSPVVKGEGKVVWVKEFDPAHPQKPHGMGLKFTRLDAAGRGVLDKMLARRQEHTNPGATNAGVPMPREGSGVKPLPGEATGMHAIITEGSGMKPLPAEGSAPVAAESSGRVAAAPPPPPVMAPPVAPPPPPPAPRPPQASVAPAAPLPAQVAQLPASRDLEALAVEIGFTDEMLTAALRRAHELCHTADAEPALAGLWGAPPAAAATAAGRRRRHEPEHEESTDVDRDEAPSAPERRAAPPDVALSDPLRGGAIPQEAAAEPAPGGLLSALKGKLFGT